MYHIYKYKGDFMKFFEQVQRLGKEFFDFKKYKLLHPALAVFVGLFVSPFAVLFILALGFCFLLSFFFAFIEEPIDYLHRILRGEGEVVKTPTQFIVYFFSWPFLFFLYAFFALSRFIGIIVYFSAVLYGYIASLAGFKFHISPNEENIKVVSKRYYLNGVATGFVIVMAVFLLVVLISAIVVVVRSNSSDYTTLEYLANRRMFIIYALIYFLFTSIYIPIGFKNKLPEQPKPVEPSKSE